MQGENQFGIPSFWWYATLQVRPRIYLHDSRSSGELLQLLFLKIRLFIKTVCKTFIHGELRISFEKLFLFNFETVKLSHVLMQLQKNSSALICTAHPSWKNVWIWKISQRNDLYPAILLYFRYPKQKRSKFFN